MFQPSRWMRAGFALPLAALLVAAAPASAADRVVLVSWDGVRRDVLRELLQYQPIEEAPVACPHGGLDEDQHMPVECGAWWTCLPTLCNFQIVDSNDAEGKTLTRPQHAQMLTGYGPEETGDLRNTGRGQIPRGYTIYEHIARSRPEIATVHVAGFRYVGKNVVRYALEDGSLSLILRRGARDNYTGVNTTDQFAEGLHYLADWKWWFYFVHYKAADSVGHRSGDGSAAYREAIQANDAQLGVLLRHLEIRGQLEGTKVYVTTDHGFNGVFHLGLENPSVTETWIASRDHDLVAGDGTILDVVPTVLDALGIDWSAADPPYRGVSRLAD